MVESMILTSYPAFMRGVEIAKMPNGAVASMLENEGTKNTIFLEIGVMVESMILTSYPAFMRGVEIAKMPNDAVASMMENEGTKNTIFLEDFTRLPLHPLLLCHRNSVERYVHGLEIRPDQNTHHKPKTTSTERRQCRIVVNVV